MKLTRIRIENYLGIRNVDLPIERSVVLVAGKNGAGKSSIAEGLRLALCAESVRVGLKKEYGQLVHRGAKAASITVERDGCEPITVSITSAGAVKDSAAGSEDVAAMPFVLDAGRFARSDRDARSNLLFTVMRVDTDAMAIERRLLARDCAPVLVTQFAPLLRTGFEYAHKEATKRVSEARGAWKAVTGENYGETKAKTWKADPGDWKTEDAERLHALDGKLASLEESLADAQRRLGAAESEANREKQYGAKLAELREKAKEFAAHQDLVNRAEAQLVQCRSALDKARAAAGHAPITPATKIRPCPACGTALCEGMDGSLAEYIAPSPVHHDPDAAGRLPELHKAVQTAEAVLARHVANRNAAERAAAEAKLMEDNAPAKPADASSPESIRQTIGSLSVEAQSVREEIRKLKLAHDTFEQADRKTKDARKHHADLCAWQKIAEVLATDGIPGELLAEALAPINERLAQSAADAGWMPVRIGEDMAITAAGTEYRLLSESEKWRTDAMICEAIAHLSELRICVLDRFDVLDGPGRSAALAWLDVLADTGEVDTVLLLGTLKEVPPKLYPSMQGHWIEKGSMQAVRQEEAEAA